MRIHSNHTFKSEYTSLFVRALFSDKARTTLVRTVGALQEQYCNILKIALLAFACIYHGETSNIIHQQD